MNNNPDTKYNHDNQLKFFNYHEYLIRDYPTVVSPTQPITNQDSSLVITHFPNVHVDKSSTLYHSTRIVRVPRTFETAYPDLIPQFSTYYPGQEPAGILEANKTHFDPVGIYDNTVFGVSSLTPLTELINPEDFNSVVVKVNEFLYQAYNPFGINGFESMADVLTGTFYSHLVTTHSKRTLKQLDTFLEQINERYDIEFISPSKTGFTSVRMKLMNGIFAIEKPSGITSSKFIGDLQHIFTNSKVFESDLSQARAAVIKNLSTDKSWTKERIDKKAAKQKVKIGHGGTLDPLASGVLVIGIGSGTKKLSYYLGECDKTYETKALLGISTTTGDSEGEILTQNKINHITKESVLQTVERFIGDLKQTPPIFSALKMNGKPLYDYAREGKPLPYPIKTRDVKVYDIKVMEDDLLTIEHEFSKLQSQLDENGQPKENSLANNPTLNDSPLYFSNQYVTKCEQDAKLEKTVDKPLVLDQDETLPDKLPLIHFVTHVSSGTYIRSLISDIGRALRSSSYMVELKRLKQSNWELGINVFKYDDFKKDERLWGSVLKQVLDRGHEVDLSDLWDQAVRDGNGTEKGTNETEKGTDGTDGAIQETDGTIKQTKESEKDQETNKRTIHDVE